MAPVVVSPSVPSFLLPFGLSLWSFPPRPPTLSCTMRHPRRKSPLSRACDCPDVQHLSKGFVHLASPFPSGTTKGCTDLFGCRAGSAGQGGVGRHKFLSARLPAVHSRGDQAYRLQRRWGRPGGRQQSGGPE
ncbi:hypothetical protein BCV69DRAFT_48468 [Microstroma glucosiphilum]|uniref:Uncharacterized protein n=1 Tax=Pseudomicrostroma glucosiphilum TaxID=1684307 RepID=A0A316U365_9BASI|nr:hypothetical protein BCV69DRAFT_48468 [Pseudomicrostroma glucosiphilum]PWN19244.1 hypothetical protein BCV69DRAFT_48468 [Pseudomicrostroma glucosiphilum]